MTDPDPPIPAERPIPSPEPPKAATLKASLPPPGMPRPAAAAIDRPPAPPAAPTPHGPTPSHSPRNALPVFTAIGFLCLAFAFFYLWQLIRHDDQPSVDPARIASLEGQTRDLRQVLASFEQRLDTLERRPAATGSAAPVDLRPLESRLSALETRPMTAPAAAPVDLAPLEARLATAERIARVQAASLALEAGQPLGMIPQAPPALARYATAPPPSLATLRAAFPEIARLARAASRPAAASGWADRVTQSLAGLVTIRRGNDVLIGAAAAAILAAARDRLDAGDLPGAVSALDALDPGAAAAAAGWKADAQALLVARAALAAMARP